jgi:hypothetical protein
MKSNLVSLMVYTKDSEPCGQAVPPYDISLIVIPVLLRLPKVWARIGRESIFIIAIRTTLLEMGENMTRLTCRSSL